MRISDWSSDVCSSDRQVADMSTLPAVYVDALLAGTAKPYTRPGSRSAIDKHPLAGTVTIGELGFAGDEQGDPRVHGGPDKAVHHYAFDHYRSEDHTSELQSLMRIPYSVFCSKKKK